MLNHSSPSVISSDPISKQSDSSYQTLSSLLIPECTASTFGHVAIKQEGFTCVFCDTNRKLHLCSFCYEHCHQKCRDDQPYQYKQMYSKEKSRLDPLKEFACDCGLILKHIVTPIPKEEFSPCQLSLIDQQFISNQIFFCEEDNMKLCSMCYFICHKNCANKHKYCSNEEMFCNDSICSSNSSSHDNICECKFNNHNIYNEFTFQIPIFDYQKEIESFFWPIQMINTLFNTGTIFAQLTVMFENVIKEAEDSQSNYIVFAKEHPFPYLLEQFSNMFNRKFKTYYYHKTIEEIFPLSKLIHLMKVISPKNERMILAKFRLMFILLFLHIKKDFSQFKTLTTNDFMTNNILERLKLKKLLFTKSKYTHEIHSKYNLNNHFLCDFVITDFIPFMEIGFQKNILNIMEFQDELEIGLQYIAFLIKRMLFSKNQLEQLIKSLYPVYERFIFGINLKDENVFSTWVDIFKAFCEVFYLIAVNYNDLIIEEYLDKNLQKKSKEDKFNLHFIHYQSEYGELLFKMIVKSCIVLAKHFELIDELQSDNTSNICHENCLKTLYNKTCFMKNVMSDDIKKRINPNGIVTKMPQKGILFEKGINIFNECLKIFSITDNTYFYQIKNLKDDDISFYYSFITELKKIDNNENIMYSIKEKLEDELKNIFMEIRKMDTTQSSSFEKHINEFFNSFSKQSFESSSSVEQNDLTINQSKVMAVYIKPYITSLTSVTMIPSFIIEVYLNIVYSNIDDTITKIFVLLSDRRYPKSLSFELLNKGLCILSFLLLSKEGTKRIFIGKTFTRMNKLLHRYSYNKKGENDITFTKCIITFIKYAIKTSKLYQISLKNNKILPRIKKNLLLHINTYYSMLNCDEIDFEFKSELNDIISIFTIIKDNLSTKENSDINETLINFFCKNIDTVPLWSVNSFYNYYDKELDDKGYPAMFTNNSMKVNTEITTNIIDTEKNHLLLLSSNKESRNSRRIDLCSNKKLLISTKLEHDEDTKDIDLLFSFFDYLSNDNLYYIEIEKFDSYKPIYDLFRYEDSGQKIYPKLFKYDKLSLKQKITMLKLSRIFCFITRVQYDNDENSFSVFNHITSKEYLNYLSKTHRLSKEFPSISSSNDDEYDNLNEIKIKIDIINDIESFISILSNELNFFPLKLTQESSKEVYEYTKELLLCIQTIMIFFYTEKELWNKPFILFYDLAVEFLSKIEIIIKVILSLSHKSVFFIENIIKCNPILNKEKILLKFKNIKFDVFDRNEIFIHIAEGLQSIFNLTHICDATNMSSFLKKYDLKQEKNFTPFSLIEIYDYEYFYQFNKETKDSFILNRYIKEFIDINKTNFISVIQGISNESNKVNYRKRIIFYFLNYFKMQSVSKDIFSINKNYDEDNFYYLLCLIAKICFYDTNEMQKNFKHLLNENFFNTMLKLLTQKMNLLYYACKNNIVSSKYLVHQISLSKISLQFIQLMGEDFNSFFHPIIFKSDNSFFDFVIIHIKHIIMLLDLNQKIECELPYDKLIVTLSNLIEFVIEFIVTKDYADTLEREIDKLLFEDDCLLNLLKIDPFAKRNNLLNFVKLKIVKLLISYLQNGKKINTITKLIEKGFTTLELYEELLSNFQNLLNQCELLLQEKIEKLNKTNDINLYVQQLINLYIYESSFRDTLQLSVCLNLFILIKIYELKYYRSELSDHFFKVENLNQKMISNNNNLGFNTLFAFKIYKFLEQIVISVQIKTDGTNDTTEEKVINYEDDYEVDKNTNENLQITFFIKPYIAFFISKQTKNSFENNVDRDSACAKYASLISANDYFLFEMVVNRNTKNFSKFLSDINYVVLEWTNFIFILVNNAILIVNNYKSWTLPEIEYNTNDEDFYEFNTINLIIAIVQVCFILIVLCIWFKFKFCLYYMKHSLLEKNNTFIFRQKTDCGNKKLSSNVIDFFQNCNELHSKGAQVSIYTILKEQNEKLSLLRKIYISIFSAILLNKEISVLIYTLLCLVIYFNTKSSLPLIIPMLFVANLSPTLFAIFKSIKTKCLTLITILLFIYLVVYIFMWVTYYFLADNFVLSDILDIESGSLIEESFCYSSIQCWMFIVDFGIRAGGGIADAIKKVSFKNDYQYYILRFFYDMLFHLFIVLILLNVFLGIIVDAFAELRNENWKREKDKNNICFICQLSRDDCISRNIDFDNHVNNTHYLWNYVYFMTSLHLRNVLDFNRLEKYVWDKLGNQDFSWLPLEKSKDM